jgi:hypothetical protein
VLNKDLLNIYFVAKIKSTDIEDPLYSADELYGVVGASLTRPFDVREVVHL